ncbi:sugar kinase [Bradyrhizobium oligotrophicum S58]|uniref:Sugar kinase n=1 Tax=Bradyrhizobium oligotrophicum S58 TaxID=1245469 RepID=M4ZXY8_9BRAD|nr:FGGY family carbohydrate kinase [Bradyrhizobium oligotrophicum]BAM91300.1 sugar kinase [Bradyrhizobium oligotrophicum S58]
MRGVTAVLDIGKTNVKVATFGSDGALVWERAMPNRVVPGPPYPHADVEQIWAFLLGALADANRAGPIATIVPTTHGCAAALIDDDGLVLPVMDYEFADVEEIEPLYAPLRPPFSETFSPALPAGQNIARQLAWQQRHFAEPFARAKYLLAYPQYWAWRLSGVAAAEVTSIGAHSDLWEPLHSRFSSAVSALDVSRLMPPLQPAYRRLAPIKPDLAAATGLADDIDVLCGVHDSNASLLPHLGSRRQPFTLLSTGTWVILMAPGLSPDGLDPVDDTLVNVDVEGRPVPTGRFMGGREYAALAGAHANPDQASLARVIASGAMALPSFAGQGGGGPFASYRGEILGEIAPADRAALATLYVALMSDLMLTRLGAAGGDLIVEGSFAANPCYAMLLAALRPTQPVFASTDAAGTARGAALLATWPAPRQAPRLTAVQSRAVEGLHAYRQAWAEALSDREQR